MDRPERRVDADELAAEINQDNFVDLIRLFLHDQRRLGSESAPSDVVLDDLPEFHEKVAVYPSAVATFYAPSDICGIGGMRRERIRAVRSWRKGPPRYDCAFINTDSSAEGMRGLDIVRVRLFFSIRSRGVTYPCALVHWFSRLGDAPDEDTGMWIVQPDFVDGSPYAGVIHLDSIVRAAHLIGVYGEDRIHDDFAFSDSLDAFNAFYVNKFIDHHAFEIAF